MTHYNYLIVGGGMTAAAAVSGIRQHDKFGAIGVIAAEQEPPYDRPPLSKGLWTGRKRLQAIYRELPAGITMHSGRIAREVDPRQRQVLDDRGDRYTYDKLLLATGSTPRRLPFGGEDVVYYRTVADYRRLRRLAEDHDRFAVIGGGFIGSEIAAALAMQGKQVTLIFPEAGICSRLFPAEVSAFLNDYYRQKGVEVLAESSVVDIAGSGSDLTVTLKDGRSLPVHGVVAGIGVTPNTALAEAAGLEVDNGIRVNETLQTSNRHIWAAGDLANYPDAVLDEHRRVEHEDAANSMGKAAGEIMAGALISYDHSPMFYSDLFDLGYEAVGDLDSRLDVVTDWKEPYRTGVLYYLKGDRLRGVLLWNTWDQVEKARELLAEGGSISRRDLLGRLPAS
jgi:NADPH-dependent 2,4-dienoyl-CoA reductase/sulfur reductase-like enzyme